jgi:aspartyl/asparaginyl beta-hydroxylase
MTRISIRDLARARQWCLNNQRNPALRRLAYGRFGVFDGQIDHKWWFRTLVGRPRVRYAQAEQKPEHYLPFLTARPLWEAPCPDAEFLERHWTVINDEFEALQERASHHPTVEGRVQGRGWLSLQLYYGKARSPVLRHFPKTAELLEQVPHCGNALGAVFFSILEPKTTIKPHCGPTNTRLRYHLGLNTPPGCWLEVAGQKTSWQSGKCLRFDDSFRHSVGNESDRPRTVLVIDLWHPELEEVEKEALVRGWTSWGPLS